MWQTSPQSSTGHESPSVWLSDSSSMASVFIVEREDDEDRARSIFMSIDSDRRRDDDLDLSEEINAFSSGSTVSSSSADFETA